MKYDPQPGPEPLPKSFEARLTRWAVICTPRLLTACLLTQLSLWWICHWLAWHTEDRFFWRMAEGIVRYSGISLACVMMGVLTLVIAREHRATWWLRVAWWGLTAHAGISLLRAWIEFLLYHCNSYPLGRWWMGLLTQVVIIGGTILMLFSMLAMIHAYQLVGLGLKIERRDWVIAALVLALIPLLMRWRMAFTEAASPLIFTRYLQQCGIYLLPVAATVGIVLQRQAMRMGGGQLALALRWLTAYVLLRAVLVLTSAWLQDAAPYTEMMARLSTLNSTLWQVALWLAALAAAKRAAMVFSAVQELQKSRAARRLTVLVKPT